jgi:hypothetical protein
MTLFSIFFARRESHVNINPEKLEFLGPSLMIKNIRLFPPSESRNKFQVAFN